MREPHFRPVAWAGAQAVAAGSDDRSLGTGGAATVDSRGYQRSLLRDNLALERLYRGQQGHGEPHGGKSVALERQRQATDCLRRQLVLVRSHQRNRRVPNAGELWTPLAADGF